MKPDDIEAAKQILEDELSTEDYTKDNLYGNAASTRKLEEYIIESVFSGIGKGDCLDWIDFIMKKYEVSQEKIDATRNTAELQYSILDRAKDKFKRIR